MLNLRQQYWQLLSKLKNKTEISPLLFNIVLEVQAREFVRRKKPDASR